MSTPYSTPEPDGGPTYDDPLLEWIGQPVRAEWCGTNIEAVVTNVKLDHSDHSFSGELVLKRRGTEATLRVSPEHVEPR